MLVGAFNQEKALVGAFSVIVQPVVEPMEHFTALVTVHSPLLTVTLVLVQIVAGLCSLIKVEGVRDPLVEAPDKVAEPLLLFCQAPDMMFTHQNRCT